MRSAVAALRTLDGFWQTLAFFSLYRLVTAVVLLATVLFYGQPLSIATQNPQLFLRTDLAYLTASIGFLALVWRRRPGFDLQLSLQVAADVFFLTVLMYASGGQKSGIAVLLLVVVAGAGLVGQGRMTVFFAALASVAILLEESWRALTVDADPSDFFRTGLTCIAFFGTAITARLLARRVVANEDLARRRGAELDRQLRISERIIRDMSGGVLVTDAGGVVRQANPGAYRLLGVAIAGRTLEDLADDFAALAPRWRAQRQESVDTLHARNGKPLRVRYLPGDETGGDGIIYIEDLEQMQSQAQQLKLAALGRLTANIAHEIRNPLSAISHAAELLSEDGGDPLRLRLTRIVGDNAQRLNRLVSDVLELGRRDRAEPEVLRWHGFCRMLVDEFALIDPTASSRIVVRGPDVAFLFDRGHLHRVMWNLVANALRYASVAPGSIVVEAIPAGHGTRVGLHVRDDGCGIAEPDRAQVFEPFFTTRSGGTGLGLYIARELAEANGAALDLLDNSPGAHFRVLAKGAE
jgi:two-component system, NtrC family, sensor histidine kinase PilS